MDVLRTALLTYLQAKSPLYLGKFCEIREVVKAWLSYIPQTFPHYTRHTVDHSDRIIEQVSLLLFRDAEPIVPLSGAEAYILAASALFHDCGMVVSDEEKVEILRSEDWRQWTTEGTGKDRFRAIDDLRSKPVASDPQVANFLADVQLRFLIAEFVRAQHHRRSGDLLRQHRLAMGRFDLGDPALARTIEDICIGHGLTRQELEDYERYPHERDIRGEKVNVRLMAVLLRLGDLLDLESDRACPLLLSAASPLPATSRAHWTQYQRIHHRVTSPERIEIYAECESQEEHRLLVDWCAWIQQETEGARQLVAPSRRHGAWLPPVAILGPSGTIRIRPSKAATYIASEWRLILDPVAVVDRLVNDVHEDGLAFVRELLQNAVDATRCQIYVDAGRPGLNVDVSGSDTAETFLYRYPIRVALTSQKTTSELSEVAEPSQLLVIEDSGIGMDVSIIERFFLQVGHSYYRSPEYRRQFPFAAIGRHGVGFLSVFSVSDRGYRGYFEDGRLRNWREHQADTHRPTKLPAARPWHAALQRNYNFYRIAVAYKSAKVSRLNPRMV